MPRGVWLPRAPLLLWLLLAAPAAPLRSPTAPHGRAPSLRRADAPPAAAARAPSLTRRTALLGAAAGALGLGLAAPPAAQAGFGPSGGSVSSQAPLKLLDVEEWLKLDSRKLAQRAGSLGLERTRELAREFEKVEYAGADVIDGLIAELKKDAPTEAGKAELEKLEQRRLDSRKRRQLEDIVRERGYVLERLQAQPPWVPYGAAILASFGSTVVMHPVDTLKTTRMASTANAAPASTPGRGKRGKGGKDGKGGRGRGKGGGGKGGGGKGAEGHAEGGLNALIPPELQTLDGISSLYAGLSANLLKEGPPSAVYLGVYETVKASLLASGSAIPPLAAYLIAGAVGEGIGSVLRAPSEAAKTRVQSGLASSTVEAFGQLAQQPENTIATWATSLVRDVPFGALQIAIFESTKTFVLNSPEIDIDVNTIYAEAALGGLGGFIGALFSAPADVLVTRLITQEDSAERTSPIEMAKRIYDEQGVGGFFAGAGARVAYWTPAIAIFLSLYCTLRKLGLDLLPPS